MSVTSYQAFLLSKIVALYKAIEASGDDYILGFRFLGELEDREAMALGAGLSRQQITDYVNSELENDSVSEGTA